MWSRINPSLYSVCFTGKAQGIPRCSTCASIDHMVRDCPFSAKSDLERTLEVVFAACTAKSNPGTPGESAGNHSQEICRRWNDMRCTFANCRYHHTCLGCGGNHPQKLCSRAQQPQLGQQAGNKRPRPGM